MIGGPACGTRQVIPDGVVVTYFACVDTSVSHEATPQYPTEPKMLKHVYRQELDSTGRCMRTADGDNYRFVYVGVE